ncbi:hypothetical protein ANN_07879 [Periplaneta americana]|uniref:DUF4817 domain-containing protein n=1 Tax=Periplaneta americana TaxID=6978 RepID=A0ABQ8SZV2_PERAM|nr:hypothetical protein ANN_07879 [Periplaneta americana]
MCQRSCLESTAFILKSTYRYVRSLPSKETLRGHSDSSFRGEGYIQCCVGVRLCDMYSNQELAEIHFMYGKADGNAALARRLYQERYPQRQCPDRNTFVRLHYRLCEYGKFNSPGLGRGRPRSTTPEVQEEILEAVNMTPSISTRRVALQVNVPHTTVWRLLKEYQLYPYHLQRVQALLPAHYPARVRFCQWFLPQCGVNPNFPALVLFTDEAQFTRDGITNFHNQHVWAYENPRATVPSHHQVRFFLNMWAGIIGDRLVGPHVLVNRFTGQAYTNFLENTIPSHVLEDTPLINRQHIHFLHDGAPAHFSRTARRYLDRRFPDRWIGQWDIEVRSLFKQEVDILNIFCNDNDLRKEKRSSEFQCCEGHNSEMKYFRTHVVMNYFDCLHVRNTYLKLCPVFSKHLYITKEVTIYVYKALVFLNRRNWDARYEARLAQIRTAREIMSGFYRCEDSRVSDNYWVFISKCVMTSLLRVSDLKRVSAFMSEKLPINQGVQSELENVYVEVNVNKYCTQVIVLALSPYPDSKKKLTPVGPAYFQTVHIPATTGVTVRIAALSSSRISSTEESGHVPLGRDETNEMRNFIRNGDPVTRYTIHNV